MTPTLWTFISHAGIVVKSVMLLLLIISIISWTLIFQKFFFLKNAKLNAQKFQKKFGAEININNLDKLNIRRKGNCSISRIIQAGLTEFKFLSSKGADKENILEGSERAMKIAQANEAVSLEKNLPFLATVGSTSPYIGLFGTVWGIMTAFTALGNAQQVTIAMVAPGIAEALIATAIGLFAAIPAVIAYNRYTHEVEGLHHQYETFQEGFSNLLHRKVYTQQAETQDA